MLRELCFLFIFLNSFHYRVKFTSICMANGENDENFVNIIITTFKKYYSDVRNYLHEKSLRIAHRDPPYSVRNFKIITNKKHKQLLHIEPTKEIHEAILPPQSFISQRKYNKRMIKPPSVTKAPRLVLPLKLGLSAAQVIASNGYRSETHTVLTSDGYMLTLQRIVPDTNPIPEEAVILHHGLLGSSEDWLILGPGLALPYLLADKGYDVWLLNARGNKYSSVHTTWYTDSYEFWDFSWHEMGVLDLPAVITYISEYTNDADLYYIGHSMGASALLALLSSVPEYNDMLKSAFLLAPLAFMYHAKGPLKLLAETRRKKGIAALKFLGTNEFMGRGTFPQSVIEKFCKGNERTCLNPLLLLSNGGEIEDEDLMENILSHVPAGGSAMTILHYIQLVKNGRFQMYDYGVQGNLRKYKRKFPPKYDLDAITLPISLFTSPSDWLCSTSDVVTLLPKLKHVYVHHVVRRVDFGHMDFIWAKDAPELVFNKVMDILDNISAMKDKKPVKSVTVTKTTPAIEEETVN